MPKTIKIIPGYGSIKRTTIFVGVFGTIWLIIEPLGLFGIGNDFFTSIGFKGYIILIVSSLLISICFEFIHVQLKLSGNEIFFFYTTFKSIGLTTKIYTSKNLRVNEFIEEFSLFVKKNNSHSHKLEFLFTHYEPKIFKTSDNQKIELDPNKTFAEQGVVERDQLEFEGKFIFRTYNIHEPPWDYSIFFRRRKKTRLIKD